jgi:hypothetical protein
LTTLQTATERQLRAEVYAGDQLIPKRARGMAKQRPIDRPRRQYRSRTHDADVEFRLLCTAGTILWCSRFERYQNVEDATEFIMAPRREFQVTPSSNVTMSVGDSIPISVRAFLDGEPIACLYQRPGPDERVITLHVNSTLGL